MRGLFVRTVIVALAVASCTGTGPLVSSSVPPPAAPVTLPPPPAFPDAPPIPTSAVSPELIAVLDDALSGVVLITPAEVEQLGSSGDLRVGWVLVDLLRVPASVSLYEGLIASLQTLTGVEAEPGAVSWVAYADLLLAWDVPAPDGYLGWKRTILTSVDPRWEPFFEDESDIDWREVTWGGVLYDAIPALTDPEVVRFEEGGDWLPDEDVVFGLVVGGEARVYPRRVMEVHELVNDTLGGRRIGVPYCTLCKTAVGYYLDQDGLPLELRTSGLLQRSNKLMYDAGTDSLFHQFFGTALTGPLRRQGVQLEPISVITTTWGEWREAHPDTTVVSADGGIGFSYGPERFLTTRDANGTIFPVGEVDPRLAEQETIFGVESEDGVSVAFVVSEALEALAAGDGVVFGGVRLLPEAGGLKAVGARSGLDLTGHEAFWFAWSQFRSGTLLWPKM